MIVYVIGSLRNPEIPNVANRIQAAGHEAFADWYGAGPEADDKWKDYEIQRGKTYLQALKSYGAQAVFNFDKKHLERADAVVLVAPAGKSGHLELGWSLGRGKRGYYLLDTPDRWDVMLQFCTLVTDNLDDIIKDLCPESTTNTTMTPPPEAYTLVGQQNLEIPTLSVEMVTEMNASGDIENPYDLTPRFGNRYVSSLSGKI